MIRVLLADDHPVFRHGLRALLGALPDVDVVAESADGSRPSDSPSRSAPTSW